MLFRKPEKRNYILWFKNYFQRYNIWLYTYVYMFLSQTYYSVTATATSFHLHTLLTHVGKYAWDICIFFFVLERNILYSYCMAISCKRNYLPFREKHIFQDIYNLGYISLNKYTLLFFHITAQKNRHFKFNKFIAIHCKCNINI